MVDRIAAMDELLGTTISFNFQLPSAPAVSYVDTGGAATGSCPGSVSSPQAAPGRLCLYLELKTNIQTTGPYLAGFGIDAIDSHENDGSSDPFGAQIYGRALAAGRAGFQGTYAVTAP